MLETLRQDLRFAIRQFRKRPGFALLAAITLGLGIGATTAVYTIVHAVLLRPLPYSNPGSLVVIWDNLLSDGDQQHQMLASYADFEQYRLGSTLLTDFAAAGRTRVRLTYGSLAHTHLAGILSGDALRGTLGVRAEIGRIFTEEESSAGCITVLQHKLWTTAFGADPSVAGRSISIEGTPCTVVGVMPASFTFFPVQADLWFPLGHQPNPTRQVTSVAVFARLKPGIAIEQARQELSALHTSLHQNDPADGPDQQERDQTAAIDRLQSEFTYLSGPTLQKNLLLVFAGVSLLLLIACLNVSTLLLARLSDRGRELVVRAALGAGRLRLVRQLLTEGLLLSGMGTALGVGFAVVAVRVFRWQSPIYLPPHAGEAGVNVSVLLFASAVSIAATLLFALAPALQVSRIDLVERLKTTGRSFRGAASRSARILPQSLVAAQIALSMTLAMGAGLLLTSVLHTRSEDLGFQAEGVTVASIVLPQSGYRSADSRLQVQNRLRERLQALPGIDHVALGSFPPSGGGTSRLEIQGEVTPRVFNVADSFVGPGLFELLRAPLLAGRTFTEADGANATPVAIITDALAREYFRERNPLGQSIRVAWDDGSTPWRTVVGVVGRWPHLVNDAIWRDTPAVFYPMAQFSQGGWEFDLGIRLTSTRPTLAREIAAAVSEIDPEIELRETQPLTARVSGVLAYPRFRAVLAVAFGLAALLIAAVGLHGLLAHIVARRIPEFGIRRAVGAQTFDVVWLIARQGGIPVLLGLGLGTAGAYVSGRILEGMLYGVHSTDARMFGMAILTILLTAIFAMALPAKRAAQVSPMAALRDE